MSVIPDASRRAVISALANAIVALNMDHPTRVAIDGRSAAGKTTLADELAEELRKRAHGVLRASIDSFHYPGHKFRSIDGIFLLHSELCDHWDYVIWLDIDTETTVDRAAQRDVAWVGSARAVEDRYRRFWVPAHELYEQITRAPLRAHAFIDNRVIQQPRLLRLSQP